SSPTLSLLFRDPLLLLSLLTRAELCMILLPIAVYWLFSTALCVLSYLGLSSVELHRIPTDQKARPKNRVSMQGVMVTVLAQHVVQALVAVVLVVATRPDEERMRNWRMESGMVLVAKLGVATVIVDTYQYWMHRWMHVNRWLYRNFHSVHHQLTVPFAFGALYNHPVEGFLMDTVSGALPSLILDMHPWTSTLFYVLATLKTVEDHCGYHIPLSPFRLFFPNDAAFHDTHHWGRGRMYNFSQPFYTFWDRLCGTEFDGAMERKRIEREGREKMKKEREVVERLFEPKGKAEVGGEVAADEVEGGRDEGVQERRRFVAET
ncbi:hypothetical protein HK101_001847, partial [Irineochytrium annulatum]